MPPKKKAEPTWRDLLPSELEALRDLNARTARAHGVAAAEQ